MKAPNPSPSTSPLERSAAAAGLIVLAPLLIAAAALIALIDGPPIFFRQRRLGLFGHPFTLLKFRSMRAPCPRAITNERGGRVTRLGRVLRRYKVDELPQLWNVLRGEMRFIGPRPEIPSFLDIDDPRHSLALHALPGITDLASLIYRNEEEILARRDNPARYYRERILPEKLRLSLIYRERRSTASDLKLVALTVWYSLFPSRFDSHRAALLMGAASEYSRFTPAADRVGLPHREDGDPLR